MNRLRKSRRLFGCTVSCKETLRCQEALGPEGAATMFASDQLRSIRRRAAVVQEPSADSLLRMEHIAMIRRAIAEGRYHVSATDLAQRLIHHMLANRTPKL